MDVAFWYAAALGGLLTLSLLKRPAIWIYAWLVYCFKWNASKFVIKRRYFSGITFLHAILFTVFISVNVAGMAIDMPNSPNLSQNLIFRSGLMASINTVPLFLGGRTSSIVNWIGVPLHTYYLAHHWIGRVAIAQGFLHGGLAIASGIVPVSGIVVAVSLALILCLSFYFVRRSIFEVFQKLHLFLVLVAIGSLIWHLIPDLKQLISPIIALILWMANEVLQRLWSRNSKKVTKIHLGKEFPRASALKLIVDLDRPVKIAPGQYFYLTFKGDLQRWEQCQAHPFMVTWWDETDPNKSEDPKVNRDSNETEGVEVDTKEDKVIAERLTKDRNAAPESMTKTLSFVIQPQRGLTRRLLICPSIREVHLEGPYGQNLNLERFEKVILVAHGIGLAGILSYAHQLASWKHSRIMSTRKVDIYWLLEENYQQEWFEYYLKELQELDWEPVGRSGNKLIQIWCYYPQVMDSKPPLDINDACKCFYPETKIYTAVPDAIEKVTSRSPGKSIVVACGKPSVTKAVRDDVRKFTTKNNIIEFVEVEYQPPGSHHVEKSKFLTPAPKIEEEKVKKKEKKKEKEEDNIELRELYSPRRRNQVGKVVNTVTGYQTNRSSIDGDLGMAQRVEQAAFV